jgi:threonine dehydratase
MLSTTTTICLLLGVMVVDLEPVNCRGLNAAVEHGGPVDVTVDSVAADSLGARCSS